MSKKFNFNFKFLERFKKNKNSNESEIHEEVQLLEDDHQFEDDNDFDPTTDPKKIYNENLDEEIQKEESVIVEHDEKLNPALINNTALLNPHNPTDEIINLDDLVKLHREKIESGEDVESFDEQEETDPGQFVELKSSSKIDELLEDAKVKQSFSFLSFKDKFKKFTNTPSAINEKPINTSWLSRFEWSQIVLKFFSPYNRQRIHTIFIIGLIGTFTYLLGKNSALIVGLFKAPSSSSVTIIKNNDNLETLNTTSEDITKVTSVNLFNAKTSETEATKGPTIDIESIVCDTGEKPTELPLKLMDTVVLQDSVKSVAAVQVRGRNELLNIREGEKLESMAEISKINRLNVVIKNLETGSCEFIGNNEDETAASPIKYVSAKAGKALLKSNNPEIKTNGNNFKITKNYRNKMLANINQILTEAKAIQITNPDGTLAYKMTEVVPGSLYSQLNIQENDVITHINGKKIENLNELMSLLGRIKEIDQFQLTLKRNGINENLEYNFE